MTKSELFKRAWEIAREASANFGGSVKSYFAEALKQAHKESKKMTKTEKKRAAYKAKAAEKKAQREQQKKENLAWIKENMPEGYELKDYNVEDESLAFKKIESSPITGMGITEIGGNGLQHAYIKR